MKRIGVVCIMNLMIMFNVSAIQTSDNTISPSKQYSYIVDEINRNYHVCIMKGNELSYTDDAVYRKRDKFFYHVEHV